VKHEKAARRGGGNVRSLEALRGQSSNSDRPPAHVVGRVPTPAEVAEIIENCCRLLDSLNDKTLRDVALAKMEGYTNEELADRLELAVPTIERKLGRIRRIWGKEMVR
jgi:DNA-directed RNA polymerase specialized sigma24 family protein